jgi:hypothetical protein
MAGFCGAAGLVVAVGLVAVIVGFSWPEPAGMGPAVGDQAF